MEAEVPFAALSAWRLTCGTRDSRYHPSVRGAVLKAHTRWAAKGIVRESPIEEDI
jgi:hypothetical protein